MPGKIGSRCRNRTHVGALKTRRPAIERTGYNGAPCGNRTRVFALKGRSPGPLEEGSNNLRVIVCGGRDYRNAAFIWRTLDALHAEEPFTAFIQGGARGADRFAKDWARTKPELQRFECKAEWTKYGDAAGPIRNSRMLEWKPDLVIAFPGGTGTADMTRKAERAGVTVKRFE